MAFDANRVGMSWITDIRDIANRLVGIVANVQKTTTDADKLVSAMADLHQLATDTHAIADDVHAIAGDVHRLTDFTLQVNIPATGRLSFGAPIIN